VKRINKVRQSWADGHSPDERRRNAMTPGFRTSGFIGCMAFALERLSPETALG
jgi:hypothetical protein